MNTPVTHGSGVMIVTGTGAGHQVGQISGMLAATAPGADAADQAAQPADAVDRGGGRPDDDRDVRAGPQPRPGWDALFVSAIALAIAAIPEALPTVVQVDLVARQPWTWPSRTRSSRTCRSVETLGFTSAINSDKTGTLTMNQMTAVEVVDPTDRYTISGSGLRPRGKGPSRRRHVGHDRRCHPAVRGRQRRQARGRQGRRRPHRGRAAGPRPQGRSGHRRHPRAAAPAGDAAVRPDLQADGDLQHGDRRVRRGRSCGASSRARRRRCWTRAATALSEGRAIAVGRRPRAAGERRTCRTDGGPGPAGDGRGHPRPRPGRIRPGRRPARPRHRSADDQPGRHGRPAPRRIQGRGRRRPGRPHPGADGHR